jgi:hypothetical protein
LSVGPFGPAIGYFGSLLIAVLTAITASGATTITADGNWRVRRHPQVQAGVADRDSGLLLGDDLPQPRKRAVQGVQWIGFSRHHRNADIEPVTPYRVRP